MKKELKGFTVGVLSTSLILASSTVFAAPVQKQINAVYNNINLVINGQQYTPKDSDGNVVEPFISNGTTYLPVRAVADALGQPVDWDPSTATVYLGKKPDGALTSLTSLTYARLDSGGRDVAIDTWRDTPFMIAGKRYDKGISFSTGYSGVDSKIVYNTNSLYTKLTGVFGVDDTGKNNGTLVASLKVIGDGKIIYTSNQVHAGDAINVDVDISNVNQLTIDFKTDGSINPVFGNPQLK